MTKPTEINSTIIVVAVAMACTIAFLILITAIMIMICIVLKKKAKKSKEQKQDVSVFTEPMKCDWTPEPSDENVYDEIKEIFESTTQFVLTDNEAYSSFKPSAAAEVPLNSKSVEL